MRLSSRAGLRLGLGQLVPPVSGAGPSPPPGEPAERKVEGRGGEGRGGEDIQTAGNSAFS